MPCSSNLCENIHVNKHLHIERDELTGGFTGDLRHSRECLGSMCHAGSHSYTVTVTLLWAIARVLIF